MPPRPTTPLCRTAHLPALSGPFWTGPLQDVAHLLQLAELAEQSGWAGRGGSAEALPWTKKGSGVRSLGELLQLLAGEADPRLPPWWVVGRAGCGGVG